MESLKNEMAGMRTNRPNVGVLEGIRVEAYGNQTSLKQVASLGVLPPREMSVTVWDKELVAVVAKAIEAADLGLTPNIAGNVIMVHLPELTAERRELLIKKAKQIAEDFRIQIRHARDEVNREIQKQFDDKVLGEDDKFALKEAVQKETEKTNADIEKALSAKIEEINN